MCRNIYSWQAEPVTHAHEASHPHSITIMNRPSTSLPESMQVVLGDSLNLEAVPRVPVYIHPSSPHLLFDDRRLLRQETCYAQGAREKNTHRTTAYYSPVPDIGSECRLVLDKHHRFLGRVVRAAQFQKTRVVLIIAHLYAPAVISLAVPYQFWLGRDKTRSLQGVLAHLRLCKYPRKVHDNGEPLPGKRPDIALNHVLTPRTIRCWYGSPC